MVPVGSVRNGAPQELRSPPGAPPSLLPSSTPPSQVSLSCIVPHTGCQEAGLQKPRRPLEHKAGLWSWRDGPWAQPAADGHPQQLRHRPWAAGPPHDCSWHQWKGWFMPPLAPVCRCHPTFAMSLGSCWEWSAVSTSGDWGQPSEVRKQGHCVEGLRQWQSVALKDRWLE